MQCCWDWCKSCSHDCVVIMRHNVFVVHMVRQLKEDNKILNNYIEPFNGSIIIQTIIMIIEVDPLNNY